MTRLSRFHGASPRADHRARRGFTLVELLVVVLVITILAVIAVPGISRQLANRRARSSADFIASLYRSARLRAMARGSAVLVRFDASTSTFQVREAIWGAAGTVNQLNQGTNLQNNNACAQLPVSSCPLTKWGASDAGNQLLETFDASAGGELTVTMQRAGAPTTDVASLDVCFSPTGRVFHKLATETTQASMVPMTGAPRARVRLANGVGLDRQVVIPPSGVARVSVVAP